MYQMAGMPFGPAARTLARTRSARAARSYTMGLSSSVRILRTPPYAFCVRLRFAYVPVRILRTYAFCVRQV